MIKSIQTAIIVSIVGCIAWTAPATKNNKKPQGFSDEAVGKAIERGVKYLLRKQRDDGSWKTTKAGNHKVRDYRPGATAIATYALIEAGVNPQHEQIAKALEVLKRVDSNITYILSLRASAYGAAMKHNKAYRRHLAEDTRKLYNSTTPHGAYSYFSIGRVLDPRTVPEKIYKEPDNSNAQYGLLGVWAGQRWNVEVPREYWLASRRYWMATQHKNGGWGYATWHRRQPYPSMTLAGLASLYVCTDNIHADGLQPGQEVPERKAIHAGLRWIERKIGKTLNPERWTYYTLFGLERVGLASGYKYFGKTDWYKRGAMKLVRLQKKDGSWEEEGGYNGGPNVSTSYALLFLIRGRQPVLFNKLEFEGDWNNRPRDMATLTRWISRTFESDVAWQIIGLEAPVREWHDAPILYISAVEAPEFSDDDLDKLRTFVHQGGTLLSCAEYRGENFSEGMREIYRRLFPEYEMTPCEPEHPLYRIHFPLRGRPETFEISNGIRPLAIHTDEDLPRDWQLHNYHGGRTSFQWGANLYFYVTDKGSLRARGTSHWPRAKKVRTRRTVRVARLKHAGNWNPEPLAYERFRRKMAQEHKTKVEMVGPLEIAELNDADIAVAAMTGTGQLQLDDEQREAIKTFVADGGTLVIDAAGGSEAFATSAREQIAKMYPSDFGQRLRPLAMGSEIYQLDGLKMERVKFRRHTQARLGGSPYPRLRAVTVNERPGVIFSAEDITYGLVGTPAYDCDGYAPESAFELMRNIVLSAADAE